MKPEAPMTTADREALNPLDEMKRWNKMSWKERYEDMQNECDALREQSCRAIIQLKEQLAALRAQAPSDVVETRGEKVSRGIKRRNAMNQAWAFNLVHVTDRDLRSEVERRGWLLVSREMVESAALPTIAEARAAALEEAAKVAEDGFYCRTCRTTFLCSEGHDGCEYPNWDRMNRDMLAAAIRSLEDRG